MAEKSYSRAMKTILQRENPVLRKIAQHVPIEKINSPQIQNLIKEMIEAMHSQKDGIALAAPQIGESLRIFVVDGSLLKQADPSYTGEPIDLVFVNPEIKRQSKEKVEVEEGCLSVRWLYGLIKRSTKVTIKAYDEKAKPVNRGASGLLAQIFQHEVDHLEGKLFTDFADDVWEMSAEEIADLQKA
jgi:peptide deformylase